MRIFCLYFGGGLVCYRLPDSRPPFPHPESQQNTMMAEFPRSTDSAGDSVGAAGEGAAAAGGKNKKA